MVQTHEALRILSEAEAAPGEAVLTKVLALSKEILDELQDERGRAEALARQVHDLRELTEAAFEGLRTVGVLRDWEGPDLTPEIIAQAVEEWVDEQ